RRQPDAGFEWAQRFDEAARSVMTDAPTGATDLQGHPDYPLASPTPDHFIPLLYLAGLAGAAARPADVLIDGYVYGSLSMTAYTLDLPSATVVGNSASGACELGSGPPDGSNI